MEKIKDKDAILNLSEHIIKINDRLKTLEEDNALQKKMIRFIMDNITMRKKADGLILISESLQDLWDEENEDKKILSEREWAIVDKTFGKPTDNSEKIEEIIEALKDRFVISDGVLCEVIDNELMNNTDMLDMESWLRDKLKEII